MFAPSPYEDSLFTGPDPVADYFSSGVLASAFLNSTDDFVYLVNQLGESPGEYYEAIDLTTAPIPEPASILLLRKRRAWSFLGHAAPLVAFKIGWPNGLRISG